jgi:hypothetical protein
MKTIQDESSIFERVKHLSPEVRRLFMVAYKQDPVRLRQRLIAAEIIPQPDSECRSFTHV